MDHNLSLLQFIAATIDGLALIETTIHFNRTNSKPQEFSFDFTHKFRIFRTGT